jgi:tRNA dimethylallyltransferase
VNALFYSCKPVFILKRNMTKKPKVVVITGPTACGKTLIGVDLALALEGEIINADSMQVYREMNVGTAKPTIEEQKGINHHLFDVVDPNEEFNAAIYRIKALGVINDIFSRGKNCFVVGGTGLYIKSLLEGIFDCPPVDPELRKSLRRQCRSDGSRILHERLERMDPEYAKKVHPNDSIRIIRALEIINLTDRVPSDLIKLHSFNERPLDALKLCIKVDREELYSRINKRSEAMVKAGLVEETEQLLSKGYSPDLKPMKAIGYRHMIKYLKGDWSLEEAIRKLQGDTRRYAKRQLTWFRADQDMVWVAAEDFEPVLKKVKDFLREL